jgi:hypothetical protein
MQVYLILFSRPVMYRLPLEAFSYCSYYILCSVSFLCVALCCTCKGSHYSSYISYPCTVRASYLTCAFPVICLKLSCNLGFWVLPVIWLMFFRVMLASSHLLSHLILYSVPPRNLAEAIQCLLGISCNLAEAIPCCAGNLLQTG